MKNKLITICVLIFSMFTLVACGNDDSDTSERKEKDKEVISNVEEELMSEEEAEELLEEYYEIAEDMYYLSFDELDVDYDNVINDSMYKIENYEDIMEKYFSEDFRDEFTPALLMKEKGEYFLLFGGFAEYKEDIKFENIEIESQKISCIVSYSVSVPDEVIEKDAKSKFILVKEDDEWKIEHYSYESENSSSDDSHSNKLDENQKAMEDTLLNEKWVKENLYLRRDCFGEEIPEDANQELTYTSYKLKNGAIIVFVQASASDYLSVDAYAIIYSDGDYRLEHLIEGVGHESHCAVETYEENAIYEYMHMGVCSAIVYKVSDEGLTVVDELEPVESEDYSEIDELKDGKDYKYIEDDFDNISSIIY